MTSAATIRSHILGTRTTGSALTATAVQEKCQQTRTTMCAEWESPTTLVAGIRMLDQ